MSTDEGTPEPIGSDADENEDSGDWTEALIAGAGVFALSLLVPALTAWDPPGWAIGAAVAVAVGTVRGVMHKRAAESPYQAQLEEMRREAEKG